MKQTELFSPGDIVMVKDESYDCVHRSYIANAKGYLTVEHYMFTDIFDEMYVVVRSKSGVTLGFEQKDLVLVKSRNTVLDVPVDS